MLPTFIIGLREGLEAALIVGIIAAFLRQRGQGLGAMWIGVGTALTLSLAVGLALKALEHALPQREQEALETVIGVIAVVFVTGMILWMHRHARDLKRNLEGDIGAALGKGGGLALAVMAFLAVLREGFETSVFLLATLSAAQSGFLASLGAALGLALSVAIGWGIYLGGVKLDLGRFFRWTGAFLILVAAGLTLQALRTAHEAGWLLAGQRQVADLAALVAPGSVQSALITGVLGIPADPRLVEVLGWAAYLIPVTLIVFWPRRLRPDAQGALRLRLGGAGALVLLAAGLALGWPKAEPAVRMQAPMVTADGETLSDAQFSLSSRDAILSVAGQRLSLPLSQAEVTPERHQGLAATHRYLKSSRELSDLPARIGLQELVTLTGGRLPVGLNPARHPGPYAATWQRIDKVDLWTASGALLDAEGRTDLVLTLSQGGLQTSRVLRIERMPDGETAGAWRIDPAVVAQNARALRTAEQARIEARFWAGALPLFLLLGALALIVPALRAARRRSLSTFQEARS